VRYPSSAIQEPARTVDVEKGCLCETHAAREDLSGIYFTLFEECPIRDLFKFLN